MRSKSSGLKGRGNRKSYWYFSEWSWRPASMGVPGPKRTAEADMLEALLLDFEDQLGLTRFPFAGVDLGLPRPNLILQLSKLLLARGHDGFYRAIPRPVTR